MFGKHDMGKLEMMNRRIAVIVPLVLAGLLIGQSVHAQPARDPISDRVGATAGQFRVDESGAATYQIPLYTPPGTAGVVPQVSLAYSSQGGNGVLGKGWAISGTSAIARCRATREHGDFITGGVPEDGNPGPVAFTTADRFCLDGQRLIPAATNTCRALSGATVTAFRTEVESFQRVCAYTFVTANGPRFFTVERRDGSTSWYGDRNATSGNATGNRVDGLVASNETSTAGRGMTWAQTRFMDSTGNYIDYLYQLDPSGTRYFVQTNSNVATKGEQILKEIQYTGKAVLPGQTGTATLPYASLVFNYSAQDFFSLSYVVASQHFQSQRLESITVRNGAVPVRHYQLSYTASPAQPTVTSAAIRPNVLASVTECSTPTGLVSCSHHVRMEPGQI